MKKAENYRKPHSTVFSKGNKNLLNTFNLTSTQQGRKYKTKTSQSRNNDRNDECQIKRKTNFQVFQSAWEPDSKLSKPNGKAATQMKYLNDIIHPFQLNFLTKSEDWLSNILRSAFPSRWVSTMLWEGCKRPPSHPRRMRRVANVVQEAQHQNISFSSPTQSGTKAHNTSHPDSFQMVFWNWLQLLVSSKSSNSCFQEFSFCLSKCPCHYHQSPTVVRKSTLL